jgi:hypothetical protein
MSVHVAVQALEWLPVLGLVTVHVLIERGRLPRFGWAFRIAACAAAASVLAASLATGMWPVAALGLLWLRTEVFSHPPVTATPEPDPVAQNTFFHDKFVPSAPPQDPAVPAASRTTPARTTPAPQHKAREIRIQPDWVRPPPARGRRPGAAGTPGAKTGTKTGKKAGASRPRSGFMAGLLRYGPPAMAALFKIEIIVVVIVLLVLFGSWSSHQRSGFNKRSNTTLCGLMGGC